MIKLLKKIIEEHGLVCVVFDNQGEIDVYKRNDPFRTWLFSIYDDHILTNTTVKTRIYIKPRYIISACDPEFLIILEKLIDSFI